MESPFQSIKLQKEIIMKTANLISKTPIEQTPMPFEEIYEIFRKELPPDTTTIMSKEYGIKIRSYIEDGKYNLNKRALARAYRSLASYACANQIAETGHFDPSVNFDVLDDVQVFPGLEKGVEVCNSCHGLGGLIKFKKKPEMVQCLKCKTVEFTRKGKVFKIDDKILTIDGVKTAGYSWLFGNVVETCARCKGTGRYKDKTEGLSINVKCTACEGEGYRIVKCRTCRGKQKLKIQVLVGNVQSITPCKICHGLGFVKPSHALDNPVLDKKLGKDLATVLSGM